MSTLYYYGIELPEPEVKPEKQWYWWIFRIYGHLILTPFRQALYYVSSTTGGNKWRFFFSKKLYEYCWKGTVHVPIYSRWLHKILWKCRVEDFGYSNCPCCGSEDYGNVIDNSDSEEWSKYYEELSSDSYGTQDGTIYEWSAYVNCPRCGHRGHYSDSN